MSAAIMKVLVGLVIVAMAAARVARDAPNPTETDSFSHIFEEASKHLKELESAVVKAFGFENTEEFRAKAEDQGRQLANNLDVWGKKFQQETEGLKDNSAVQELRAYFEKTVADINANLPKTTEEVKKFAENVQGESEKVVNKIKELGDTEEAKNIKDLSQQLLDSAVVAVKGLASTIQENIKNSVAQ